MRTKVRSALEMIALMTTIASNLKDFQPRSPEPLATPAPPPACGSSLGPEPIGGTASSLVVAAEGSGLACDAESVASVEATHGH